MLHSIITIACPANVPTAIPNVPRTTAVPPKSSQPFAAAIASAVVGPPTFALDAINSMPRGIFIAIPSNTVKMVCVAS